MKIHLSIKQDTGQETKYKTETNVKKENKQKKKYICSFLLI